jgi:hypothetical protein
MEAIQRSHTVVHDLDCALAMLAQPSRPGSRRMFAAYLSIESAKELLCDEREPRAVLLLLHARRVLDTLSDPAEAVGAPETHRGAEVSRHLDNALSCLRTASN